MDRDIGNREAPRVEQIVKSIANIGGADGNMMGVSRPTLVDQVIDIIVNQEAQRTKTLFHLEAEIIEFRNLVDDLRRELLDWELSALRAGEGAARISYERARQQIEEGYGANHDDAKVSGTLVQAAIAFALGDPTDFPWADRFWKPSDDKVRNLEKAGALIAAEIDRLLRSRRREDSNVVVRGNTVKENSFDSRPEPDTQERPFA